MEDKISNISTHTCEVFEQPVDDDFNEILVFKDPISPEDIINMQMPESDMNLISNEYVNSMLNKIHLETTGANAMKLVEPKKMK